MAFENIDPTVIPNNPLDRVHPKMKQLLLEKKPFIDIHTHVFNYMDVPSKFIGIRLPMGSRFIGWMSRLLHSIKGGDRDKLSRYAYFLETMKSRSSEAIFRRMYKSYYQEYPEAIYGVLTMDMDIGIDGRANRSIWTQLGVVAQLREQYPTRVLPYACIDPRRNDEAIELFQTAFDFDKHLKYFGVKVYPSLGYLPSHPQMMKMYEVCAMKNIPVLTHCSSGSTHGSDRKLNDVKGVFATYEGENKPGPHQFKAARFRKKRDYRNFFNRPHHWIPVLEKYPKLRLNIAHFGGDEAWELFVTGKDKTNWVQTVIDLVKKYENVYADFSYTMYSEKYSKKLRSMMEADPELADKVLFGSDYYMLVIEDKYDKILARFKGDMGPELMHKIAVENPHRHLFAT
jgi:predicted TIM-barrel fold metal-dependent hydrolase